jgi:hypothetical protein
MIPAIEIANILEKQYLNLNFRNHCYLRIAYDNAVCDKWDNVVSRPFSKNASVYFQVVANENLKMYLEDKSLLIEHNQNSLKYRKKL